MAFSKIHYPLSDQRVGTHVKEHHVWVCENGVCYHLYPFPGMTLNTHAPLIASDRTMASQGFSLTIGSELFTAIDKREMKAMALAIFKESVVEHGSIVSTNATSDIGPLTGSFAFIDSARPGTHIIKGPHEFPATRFHPKLNTLSDITNDNKKNLQGAIEIRHGLGTDIPYLFGRSFSSCRFIPFPHPWLICKRGGVSNFQ